LLSPPFLSFTLSRETIVGDVSRGRERMDRMEEDGEVRKGRRGEMASSWRRMQEMKKDWKRLAFRREVLLRRRRPPTVQFNVQSRDVHLGEMYKEDV
jgi:hypothetical protein